MKKNNEVIVVIIWFTVVFANFGVMWYFPQLEIFGIYIMIATMVFAIYYGYFHEKIGLIWGIPLTLISLFLSYISLDLVNKIPFIAELLHDEIIVVRYSVANVIITLVIAVILRLVRFLSD